MARVTWRDPPRLTGPRGPHHAPARRD